MPILSVFYFNQDTKAIHTVLSLSLTIAMMNSLKLWPESLTPLNYVYNRKFRISELFQ